MDKQSRAIRRHHLNRIKAKQRRHWSRWHHLEATDRYVGKLANTPTLCSCWMCGNPRKYFKHKRQSELTLKEQAHLLDLKLFR